jgi:hypothetical protein
MNSIICKNCDNISNTVTRCCSCDNDHCSYCSTITECYLCKCDICDGCERICNQCGEKVCSDCVKTFEYNDYCTICHYEIGCDIDCHEELSVRKVDYYMDLYKDRD